MIKPFSVNLKNSFKIIVSLIFIFTISNVAIAQSKIDEQANSTESLDPVTKTTRKIQDNDELIEDFNLKKHNSIYFIYGHPQSKLQFSFKYEVYKNLPIYIGYTQLSFWDLKKESKPFSDVNYNPELFYSWDLNKSWIESIDIVPYEHKSNGKDGLASRSYERIYVQVNSNYVFSKFTLRTSLQIGHVYGLKDNKDLQEYYGPLQLKFSLTHLQNSLLDKVRFDFKAFAGGKYLESFHKGGREVGMSVRFGGANINPSIYVQYYAGYMESLLDYNKYTEEFRIGLIL